MNGAINVTVTDENCRAEVTMFENEKPLVELCERAAREKDSKKLLELTEQIDRILTEVIGHRNDDRVCSLPN